MKKNKGLIAALCGLLLAGCGSTVGFQPDSFAPQNGPQSVSSANPEFLGLDFFPINDSECAVAVGKAINYDGILTIPSSHNGLSVTRVAENGFAGASMVSVEIPSSVVSIEEKAFSGCYNLKSVKLNDGTIAIGDSAFQDCHTLTSIDIPASVTTIGNSVFSACHSLTSIEIPASVTSIGDEAFWGCLFLTSIDIPASVTSIGKCAFYDCVHLAFVKIPSSVISIGEYAFFGCNSLTSVGIPSSVTFVGNSAFFGCVRLASIFIPASVTFVGNSAFFGCDSLTIHCEAKSRPESWDPKWNSDKQLVVWDCKGFVESDGIYYVLCNRDGKAYSTAVGSILTLTKAAIPVEIDGFPVVSIAKYLFSNRSFLVSVEIPSSVTSIGDEAFSACPSLTSLIVSPDNPLYDSRENCNSVICTADNTLIAGCGSSTIPSSVTSIGGKAFLDCSSLTSIVIPSSVTSIGERAFQNCTALTFAEIGDNIVSIGGRAFFGCSSLTSIVIPSSVTSVGIWAFESCSSLTVYCKAKSQPSGWSSYWNPDGQSVVWGYED